MADRRAGTLVHNRPTQAAYVFGRPAGESIELASFTRGAAKRRGLRLSAPRPGGGSESSDDDDDDDTAYVQHELQPHHTLQGVALQYRVTVRAAGWAGRSFWLAGR